MPRTNTARTASRAPRRFHHHREQNRETVRACDRHRIPPRPEPERIRLGDASPRSGGAFTLNATATLRRRARTEHKALRPRQSPIEFATRRNAHAALRARQSARYRRSAGRWTSSRFFARDSRRIAWRLAAPEPIRGLFYLFTKARRVKAGGPSLRRFPSPFPIDPRSRSR